jgi:hypothetical protein
LVVDGDASSGFVRESPSYHHQRFPGNCQLEFERCRKERQELANGEAASIGQQLVKQEVARGNF